VGSFGEKRAQAVIRCRNARLVGVSDLDSARGASIAQKHGVRSFGMEEWAASEDVDAVILCVPNRFHMENAIRALEAGKHVLCEKPISRTAREARAMADAAARTGRKLKVGSNHRYFHSVMKAHEVIRSGIIGEVVSFMGRIGHNGERLKNTWFWKREISGGGTLLDNGCHLLDIARWIMGDFSEAVGLVSNVYWKDCEVEDTAAGVFTTSDGRMATIASSWRQIAGYFHFEVNGTDGYVTVDGRFDTHGGDHVYWQSLRGQGEIHTIDFRHVPPDSYVLEMEDFFSALSRGIDPSPGGQDGVAVMQMIEAIYRSKGSRIVI
jgi:predicted dehydrogenase